MPVPVSVFTPSHDPRYLNDCYRSLAAQSHHDWEWVVVLNKTATQWRPPVADERVRLVRAPGNIRGVGALKAFACQYSSGDILVELDHDDTLGRGSLAEICATFERRPDAALAYSDFTQVNADGSPNQDRFDAAAGWVYSEEDVDGHTFLRCHALAPLPHNVGYIWYAPNHVRAFRRTSYEQAGGYHADLKVLDDQDLMMRLFSVGEFVHIDRLLYFQRVHTKNTQSDPRTNAFIQSETVALYDRGVEGLASSWAQRLGLAQLRLRTATSPGQELVQGERAVELRPGDASLDVAEGSVGIIRMTDFLQRWTDREALFNECYRALCHGGMVISQTPSTDGRGAFQDPSHTSFWNENSFWYLTQQALRFAVPTLRARLQVSRLHTAFPTEWHRHNQIPYVNANLLAVKDGPRLGGPLLV